MAKDSIKYRLDKNPLTADPDDCMAQVVDNKPAKTLFVLPKDTAAGSYTLEVRTKNTGNKTDGKTLKKGAFEESVTVA